MTAEEIAGLVAEGTAIKTHIKEKKVRLDEIEAQLIAAGAAKHAGCIVIQPSPGIKPSQETIAEVKGLVKTFFSKLFVRTVTYAPVKNFRDVARALLTPAKAQRVIALCETSNSPFVKWS